jgi:hypothetical protein
MPAKRMKRAVSILPNKAKRNRLRLFNEILPEALPENHGLPRVNFSAAAFGFVVARSAPALR